MQVASLTSLLGAGSKAAMLSVRQLIFSLLAMLTASGVLAVFLTNPEFIGSQALIIRAAILDFAILLVLTAIYPLAPAFVKRPGPYGFVVCLPALLPAILYFSWLLPQRSPGEIQGDQLNSALITDASSNGLGRGRLCISDLYASYHPPKYRAVYRVCQCVSQSDRCK